MLTRANGLPFPLRQENATALQAGGGLAPTAPATQKAPHQLPSRSRGASIGRCAAVGSAAPLAMPAELAIRAHREGETLPSARFV